MCKLVFNYVTFLVVWNLTLMISQHNRMVWLRGKVSWCHVFDFNIREQSLAIYYKHIYTHKHIFINKFDEISGIFLKYSN